MSFNFPLFARLSFLTWFRSKGTHGQMSRRRRIAMLLWYTVVPVHQLLTHICFILDDIFFRAYKQQEVKAPVFLIGNFRSGSTLIQRLLSKDEHNFTTMRIWEIYLAPTITQRKMWQGIGAIDATLLKGKLRAWMDARDAEWLGKVQMHPIGLQEPDEDDGLMIMTWSTLFLQFIFPFLDDLPEYERFDQMVSPEDQKRIMEYYKGCVQRHLYFHGGHQTFLAKNPAMCGKIEAVLEYFPDARIIYLARNPFQLVPSVTNFFSYIWHFFGTPLERYPYKERIFSLIKHWYLYPLERLSHRPDEQYRVMRYDDVVYDLEITIERIYQWLGKQLTGPFRQIIQKTVKDAEGFESDNKYTLEEMGLTPEFIRQEFQEVFDYFKFETEPQLTAVPA
ncbi:MAG: sulfotransferase [Chloroflexi bacterium]|nr:MAG: sulfotransferase [Chloroflexota bacterium]MBL1195272.1 sulfotransferase [Chloroflexota bacterium]NOH12556.1 sulfotransferase [Chloroflexota bacterium]